MTSHPVQRLSLVTLGVADLARSRRFYAALGWQPAEENEGVSFYQMHGMALGLFGLRELAPIRAGPQRLWARVL